MALDPIINEAQLKNPPAGFRIGVIVSRFNEFVTDLLLKGALEELQQLGYKADQVEVYRVPGAFEIPQMAKRLVSTGRFQALACLGAVIKGDTPHFDYVCDNALRGISQLALESGLPISNGIITALDVDQAMARAGGKMGNLGSQAVRAACEMAELASVAAASDRENHTKMGLKRSRVGS